MTHQEALQLIQLPAGTDSGTIRRRLDEMVSDYQVRLTNAPTSALQQLYRGKLQGLEAARTVLLADLGGVADLPGIAPMDETTSRFATQNHQTAASQILAPQDVPPRRDVEAKNPHLLILFLLVPVVVGYWWVAVADGDVHSRRVEAGADSALLSDNDRIQDDRKEGAKSTNQVLVNEEFENTTRMFIGAHDDGQCTTSLEGGYVVDNKRRKYICSPLVVVPVHSQCPQCPLAETSDHGPAVPYNFGARIRLETAITYLKGKSPNSFGLAFGGSDGPGSSGIYRFWINDKGEWTLDRFIGAESEDLRPWAKTKALHSGKSVSNQLAIEVHGREITLFANGERLGTYSAGQEITGEVRFLVNSGARVRFAYLRAMTLK